VHRYIRDSNELLRYARFRILLYACENLSTLRENIARFLEFLVFLLVFGGSVTDLSVGARSAAAAPLCLLQVLEVNQGEGRKLARCKADPEEDTFDEARLVRVNRQINYNNNKNINNNKKKIIIIIIITRIIINIIIIK